MTDGGSPRGVWVGIYDAALQHEPPKSFRHALVVLVVAVALYFPFLGFSGFAHSEGFRVYPGWEMLEGGDWVVPHLFGQVYLRKPPLVPWLHGIAAWVFGQNEFVARGVSSTAIVAMCMLSFAFAQRWFGRPWGLVAGLACAVMPLMYWYPPGRAAEIEPIHNLCTLLAACLMIDRALGRSRGTLGGVLLTWSLALAFGGMLLSKGPAGLPVIAGVLGAIFLVTRRWILALWPGNMLMLLAGGLLFGVWFMSLKAALVDQTGPAVVEPPERFLFQDGKWLSVVLLPLSVLTAALPHSLALAWLPWRTERLPWKVFVPAGDVNRRRIAGVLAWTVAIAVLLYTVVGIGNSRYVTPAMVLLPLCVAAAGQRCWGVAALARTGEYLKAKRAGRTAFVVLLCVAVGQVAFAEYRRTARTSGKPDALRLGEVLVGRRADHIELWGDHVVDTRPEVLRYACDRAYERGQFITPRWKPRVSGDPAYLPPAGSYVVVRHLTTDEVAQARAAGEDPEWPVYQAAGIETWPLVFEGKAHNFRYRVYQSPAP